VRALGDGVKCAILEELWWRGFSLEGENVGKNTNNKKIMERIKQGLN